MNTEDAIYTAEHEGSEEIFLGDIIIVMDGANKCCSGVITKKEDVLMFGKEKLKDFISDSLDEGFNIVKQ